ncbi:kinase-like protein [Daldinia decipiens]|uniref:kinase-like protein n=1 Tax=Daldinia decipiens TaxID=326647 RepID=UPI0020C1F783|nr:kinase-like protein [Daldinia decipiens]KAI1657009.1 kinase-like protein [Daldinia decipiens]
MESWVYKAVTEGTAMGRSYGKYTDPRKTLTQPVKPSLIRDIFLASYSRATVFGSLPWEDSRHAIPIPDLPNNIQDNIEDPESDIESAPGHSFTSTPLSCSPSSSLDRLVEVDCPPTATESFSERVSNTPYTSQMRMYRFLQKVNFINWNPLIDSLKQGVPGDLRHQNDRCQLIDYGGSSSVWGAAFSVKGDFLVDALAIKLFRADRQEDSSELPTELQIMKGLEHNHIVAFVGHFQRSNHFGVIIYPLAICNLGQLLKSASGAEPRLTMELHQMLLTAIGCLSSAVMYLHTSKIVKHKDIKPENILVDKFGSVHLADFGISKQYEDETVTGGHTPFTERYAPPEVVSQCDRDLSSDIFSLGCVFLEMVTIILGKSLKVMHGAIFDRQPKGYYQSLYKVRGWVGDLKESLRSDTSLVPLSHGSSGIAEDQHLSTEHLDLILSMMAESPKERPAIDDVYELFKRFTWNCLDCRNSRDIDLPASQKLKDNKGELPANYYVALPAPLRDLPCPQYGRNVHTTRDPLSPGGSGKNCAASNPSIGPVLMEDACRKQSQENLEEIYCQMKRAVEQVIREFSPSIRSFGYEQDSITLEGVQSNTATARLPNCTHIQDQQYEMLDKLKLRITEVVREVLTKYPTPNPPVDLSRLIQYCGPDHSASHNCHRGSSSQGQPAKRGRNGHGNRVIRNEDDHDSELEDEPADGNGGNGHGTQAGSLEQPLSFACPFYRRNPERFASTVSCCFRSYRKISRLKEHLERVHRIFRCPRCQQICEKEKAVDEHLQQDDICTRQDPVVFNESYDWSQGYGQKQASDLKSRWRNLSDHEKWRNIYRILFPYDRNIPFPYAMQSGSSYLLSEPDSTPEQATSPNDPSSLIYRAIWGGFVEGVNVGFSGGAETGVNNSDLPSNEPRTGLPGYYSTLPDLQIYTDLPSSNMDNLAQPDYSIYGHRAPYLPNSYPTELSPRSLESSNLTSDSTYYTNFDVSNASSQQVTAFDTTRGQAANGDELECLTFDPLVGSWDITGNGYPRGEEYAENNGMFDIPQSH